MEPKDENFIDKPLSDDRISKSKREEVLLKKTCSKVGLGRDHMNTLQLKVIFGITFN